LVVRRFDRIDHAALMDRVRARVKDKRVLRLVKAFLKAGILTELGNYENSYTGTPRQCDARSHVVSGCIFGGSMMSIV
jgi:retron-type reverse transcriptase